MERTAERSTPPAYTPGDHGNVRVITMNEETGQTGADTILAGKTADEMKAWLSQEYGPEIGTILVRRADGSQLGIGTVHEKTTPYPSSDRVFQRTAFVFVATARGRMSPADRAAYLEALGLGDAVDAAPHGPAKAKGKRAAAAEPEPLPPKGKSKNDKAAARSFNANERARKRADAQPAKPAKRR